MHNARSVDRLQDVRQVPGNLDPRLQAERVASDQRRQCMATKVLEDQRRSVAAKLEAKHSRNAFYDELPGGIRFLSQRGGCFGRRYPIQ